jgi:hypothetical protein
MKDFIYFDQYTCIRSIKKSKTEAGFDLGRVLQAQERKTSWSAA